jgi:hypothetical protein
MLTYLRVEKHKAYNFLKEYFSWINVAYDKGIVSLSCDIV